jgi:hypothetical protein
MRMQVLGRYLRTTVCRHAAPASKVRLTVHQARRANCSRALPHDTGAKAEQTPSRSLRASLETGIGSGNRGGGTKKRRADGRWKMEDGRWQMADASLRLDAARTQPFTSRRLDSRGLFQVVCTVTTLFFLCFAGETETNGLLHL